MNGNSHVTLLNRNTTLGTSVFLNILNMKGRNTKTKQKRV